MKNKKNLLIGIIVSISLISALITSTFLVILFSSHQESFESKIQKIMDDYKIPSLVSAIINNDSIVWINGFGDQPDLETVYMIGSITKTFTATAILQLNESNLLKLDEDINQYLPFAVRHPSYPNKPITPRMLLTHKAGLRLNLIWSLEYYLNNQTIDWINENLDLGPDIIAWKDRPSLGEFLNGSLNPNGPYYDSYNWQWRPGSEFHYSNAGFQLLGYLIKQITNQSFNSYLKSNIFDPLGMDNTGLDYNNFNGKNAIPYEWNEGVNVEYPLYNLNVTGAGNLRSTIIDMTRYLRVYMNRGNFNKTQLLKPESVDLMFSKQVSLSGTSVEDFNYEGYGLGWYLYSKNILGHGGATPGFSSNMYFKKTNDTNYGVILMFNRGSAFLYDEGLINEFIPKINQIIVEKAELLG